MVSTTMNLCPGVPIMKSTDLAHWEIVNYVYDALPDLEQNNLENGKQMYSNGSWAAAIRYNEETGLFYVVFNVNGGGFFCYTTNDIENGTWQGYHIDASFHDPALLFDDGHIFRSLMNVIFHVYLYVIFRIFFSVILVVLLALLC